MATIQDSAEGVAADRTNVSKQTFNCRLHGEQEIVEHVVFDQADESFRYHWDYVLLKCGCTREIDTH